MSSNLRRFNPLTWAQLQQHRERTNVWKPTPARRHVINDKIKTLTESQKTETFSLFFSLFSSIVSVLWIWLVLFIFVFSSFFVFHAICSWLCFYYCFMIICILSYCLFCFILQFIFSCILSRIESHFFRLKSSSPPPSTFSCNDDLVSYDNLVSDPITSEPGGTKLLCRASQVTLTSAPKSWDKSQVKSRVLNKWHQMWFQQQNLDFPLFVQLQMSNKVESCCISVCNFSGQAGEQFIGLPAMLTSPMCCWRPHTAVQSEVDFRVYKVSLNAQWSACSCQTAACP